MQLLYALRAVSCIESSAIREESFQDIASRSRLIRAVLRLHRLCRYLGVGHVLVGAYGFAYFIRARLPAGDYPWLAVGYYPNEIKRLNAIDAVMGQDAALRVSWQLINGQGIRAVFKGLSVRKLCRLCRLIRRIERQQRFMPACRVMVALFLYLRFYEALKGSNVRAILVTSDYSPDGAAMAAAAAALGRARIYAPHALPSSQAFPGRRVMPFDYYVFDSEMMRQRFHDITAIRGEVVYFGVNCEQRPMRKASIAAQGYRVALFLSGMSSRPALEECIRVLALKQNAEVLVRGHPVDFSNPDFSGLTAIAPSVTISRGRKLTEDALWADIVIAGNTNAILETLRLGVPTAYWSALDGQPYDYNGFVEVGLVPDIQKMETFSVAGVQSFFDESWTDRMKYFDAAYGIDIKDNETKLRAALLRWAGIA